MLRGRDSGLFGARCYNKSLVGCEAIRWEQLASVFRGLASHGCIYSRSRVVRSDEGEFTSPARKVRLEGVDGMVKAGQRRQ